jgi:hypothetical protein
VHAELGEQVGDVVRGGDDERQRRQHDGEAGEPERLAVAGRAPGAR